MPGIGFGTLGNVGDTCCALVEAALAEGYRYIDTSRYYGNEEAVGRALARSSVPRGDIWVTTKLLHPRTPPQPDLAFELDKSLRLLQTDYVDLLLIHWPNPEVSLEWALGAGPWNANRQPEAWSGLGPCVTLGKRRNRWSAHCRGLQQP